LRLSFLQLFPARATPKKKKGDPACWPDRPLLLHLRSRAALGYLLAVVSEPFLGAFFEPFLLFFLVVVSLLLLGVWLLVAGGVAWANIMGIATANTSPKIVFFVASFLPRGLCPLHFHDAAGRPKTR
jgi:hypothetical protein